MRNLAILTMSILIYMIGDTPFALDGLDEPAPIFRSIHENEAKPRDYI